MVTLGPSARELGRDILLVLGAPRSGSTWVGKIFDSHPDVLYRHEPDTLDRGGVLARPFAADETARFAAAARSYLLRLAALQRLKTAGQMPLFRKSYRPPALQALHVAMICLFRLLALVPGAGELAASSPLPDFASRPPQRLVIKSVSGCGRAGLFAAALPQARIVFLMREPFGQIASLLHGTQIGKLGSHELTTGLWDWPGASRYGLTESRFARLALVEQLAWFWVLLNEKVMAELAQRPGVCLVHYHDLRADPLCRARALFDFAGIDWPAETEEFLMRSTRFIGHERYYQVYRNTAKPETKWQTLLSADARARIGAIVRQSTLAYWVAPDLRQPAAPAAVAAAAAALVPGLAREAASSIAVAGEADALNSHPPCALSGHRKAGSDHGHAAQARSA